MTGLPAFLLAGLATVLVAPLLTRLANRFLPEHRRIRPGLPRTRRGRLVLLVAVLAPPAVALVRALLS